MDYTHRGLCEDLAAAKGTPYIEVNLGSPWLAAMNNHRYSVWTGDEDRAVCQRADVIVIRPSYTRFCLDIFECKVSRSDLLGDLRSGKWEGYLPNCHRFYFAATKDIVSRDDIPDPAGLIVRGASGWRVVKAAAKREPDIDEHTLMSMLFYRAKFPERFLNRNSVVEYLTGGYYSRMGSMTKKKLLKLFGQSVSKTVAELAIEHSKSRIDGKKSMTLLVEEFITREIAAVEICMARNGGSPYTYYAPEDRPTDDDVAEWLKDRQNRERARKYVSAACSALRKFSMI